MTPPLVSVVVPNRDGARHLELLLPSLLRQTHRELELVVVDNASTDGSVELVARLAPAARVVRLDRNLGFAGGANAGARAARGDWLAILNNDTEVADDWLEEAMAAAARHPEAAFLACRILELQKRGRVYSAGDCFLRAGIGYRRGQERLDGPRFRSECEVFGACGAAALYRRELFAEEGGYGEVFFAYLEDVELALRLQAAGRRGVYVPAAVVFHRGGGTSGGEFAPLAVRLRTRNALLLLVRALPAAVLWRSLPMIAACQASWCARALLHGRILDWLAGMAGVVPRLAGALAARGRMRPVWRAAPGRVWAAIVRSEALAREDFPERGERPASRFLQWYFAFFSPASVP
jgi:hypothetical protein